MSPERSRLLRLAVPAQVHTATCSSSSAPTAAAEERLRSRSWRAVAPAGSMGMTLGKILVAQGGGPTAVINQSLVGVVLEARRHKAIDLVYGARHGVPGIVDEDFVDLTQETSHNLELVANTPGSALGSTRDKPDRAYCHAIFGVLKAHGIGHFFYIG